MRCYSVVAGASQLLAGAARRGLHRGRGCPPCSLRRHRRRAIDFERDPASDMTVPMILFSDLDPARLRELPIAALSEVAELLGADAGAAIGRAAILVTARGVASEIFASQALVAVVCQAEPAEAERKTASETGVLLVRALKRIPLDVQLRDILAGRLPEGALNPDQASRLRRMSSGLAPEIGGSAGPEPTRYGDWQHKGRVTDF